MSELEQVPLSDELLSLMRKAAKNALDTHEGFITPRALLLTMLDDPVLGPNIAQVVNREKLLAVETATTDAVRLPDDTFEAGDLPAVARYDTISFKTPDGGSSVWLTHEAYHIFIEGARRAEDRYMPKHVALGLAAQAVHAPGVLAALRVEPGVLADAIYKL